MTICNAIHHHEARGHRVPEPLSLRLTRTMLAIVTAIAALFLSLQPVPPAAAASGPSEVRSGTLFLKSNGEVTAEAVRLAIDVDLTVSGPTIRARVTQAFKNPTQDFVEANYVYPLPDGAAVDTLRMIVGDHVIIGDIKER